MIMIVEILQGHVHEQLLFAWLSVHHFGVGPFPRLTSQGFSHTQTIWMQPWLRWMAVAQRWLGKTQGMTDWWLIAEGWQVKSSESTGLYVETRSHPCSLEGRDLSWLNFKHTSIFSRSVTWSWTWFCSRIEADKTLHGQRVFQGLFQRYFDPWCKTKSGSVGNSLPIPWTPRNVPKKQR
jgi:hypothetical protein